MSMTTRCPCGSGEVYAECCGPAHDGTRPPATATALMRSRFSAFALGRADYLLATWHPSTRPLRLDLDPDVRWTRLEILDVVAGDMFDATGVVEFDAHHRGAGGRGVQHERSTFRREHGSWFYVSAGTG